MNIIYKKSDGSIIEFIDGEVNGLNSELATMLYDGDKTETNISEVDDTVQLDSMTMLSKLAILEAMDDLPEEREKFDMLMQNVKFQERWLATTELDLNHPLTQAALSQVDFDVDKLKRKILEIK